MVFHAPDFDPHPSPARPLLKHLAPAALAMVRYHETWLAQALRGRRAALRIPVRRVSDGGFDALRASPQGRTDAAAWWAAALARVGD